jgi:tRNA-dihydrouridine synthase B
MINADVGLWKTAKTERRLRNWSNSLPRIVQIAGFCPEMLATAAQLAREHDANIIDINMGCPAKKVCRRLAGSSLMRDPALVRRILDRVVAAIDVPVTLKMRTGWSPDQRNGVEIARIAEACGVAALTVHGRTRACRFSGTAEYDTIRAIKKAVSIPVIANGDIDSAQKAREVMHYTGADGIMIGRGAQGRPWIFNQINSYLNDDTEPVDLPLTGVRDIILQHLESLYSFYGEFTGVRVGRKHLTWYLQYREGWHRFRERIVRVEKGHQQLGLTRAFFEQ